MHGCREQQKPFMARSGDQGLIQHSHQSSKRLQEIDKEVTNNITELELEITFLKRRLNLELTKNIGREVYCQLRRIHSLSP